MSVQFPTHFVSQVADFYITLRELHQRDPEQELQGSAITVYNSLLEDAKAILRHDPLISALPEVITANNIEEPVYPRVADTLVVVGQIWSALGTGRRLPS